MTSTQLYRHLYYYFQRVWLALNSKKESFSINEKSKQETKLCPFKKCFLIFSNCFSIFLCTRPTKLPMIQELSPTCAKERNPTIQWPPVSNLFGNRGKEKLPFSRNRSPTEAGLWRGSLHKPALKLCIDRKCTTLMHNSFYPLFHQQTTTWLNSCRSPPKQTRLFCHTARGVNVAMVMKTKLNRQCLQVRLAQTWQDKKKKSEAILKTCTQKHLCACIHINKKNLDLFPILCFLSTLTTPLPVFLICTKEWADMTDRLAASQRDRETSTFYLPPNSAKKKRKKPHAQTIKKGWRH